MLSLLLLLLIYLLLIVVVLFECHSYTLLISSQISILSFIKWFLTYLCYHGNTSAIKYIES